MGRFRWYQYVFFIKIKCYQNPTNLVLSCKLDLDWVTHTFLEAKKTLEVKLACTGAMAESAHILRSQVTKG